MTTCECVPPLHRWCAEHHQWETTGNCSPNGAVHCAHCGALLNPDGTVTQMVPMDRAKAAAKEHVCHCGKWRWWQEIQRWTSSDGFTINRGLCFDCNCRLAKDGTVTPMAPMDRLEAQVKTADTLRDRLVIALCDCDSTHTPRLLPGHMRELVAAMVVVLTEARSLPDVRERWVRREDNQPGEIITIAKTFWGWQIDWNPAHPSPEQHSWHGLEHFLEEFAKEAPPC